MNKDHKIKELEERIAKLEEELKKGPFHFYPPIIVNPAPHVPVPYVPVYPQVGWPVPPYTTC